MVKATLSVVCFTLIAFALTGDKQARQCQDSNQTVQEEQKEPIWTEEQEETYRRTRTTEEENNYSDLKVVSEGSR